MPNLKRTLSTRLQFIFGKLLPGEPVWDLCCDHGYLGIKAHSSKQFPHIHFVDRVPHLIAPLRVLFAETAGASFHALPAQDLDFPLQGNVVIVGVGGELICEIIEAQVKKGTLQARRLIFGPHNHADQLQEWLCQDLVFSRQYSLIEQCSVEEKGRQRQIFIYERVPAASNF